MPTFATNGCKLYIGQPLKDYPVISADTNIYNGQSWQEIAGLISLGHIGEEVETTQSLIADCDDPDAPQRYTIEKVAYINGVMEITTALDLSNAGQIALVKGLRELSYYPFRLILNDAPAGGKPSERLFAAQIIQATEQYEEANNVAKLVTNLSLANEITRIAATQ